MNFDPLAKNGVRAACRVHSGWRESAETALRQNWHSGLPGKRGGTACQRILLSRSVYLCARSRECCHVIPQQRRHTMTTDYLTLWSTSSSWAASNTPTRHTNTLTLSPSHTITHSLTLTLSPSHTLTGCVGPGCQSLPGPGNQCMD